MDKRVGKGRQKIELKLNESEKARALSFSKRKKTLFQDADKLATWIGADVGVMLFSPCGKPCSYGSTSIENIIDRFFKVRLLDRQRDYAEGKSNVFEVFGDLCKEFQALDEVEKKRILMYNIMHPGSEISVDKHLEEQKLEMKLRVENAKKEVRSFILPELLKLDLNVASELEQEESS